MFGRLHSKTGVGMQGLKGLAHRMLCMEGRLGSAPFQPEFSANMCAARGWTISHFRGSCFRKEADVVGLEPIRPATRPVTLASSRKLGRVDGWANFAPTMGGAP